MPKSAPQVPAEKSPPPAAKNSSPPTAASAPGQTDGGKAAKKPSRRAAAPKKKGRKGKRGKKKPSISLRRSALLLSVEISGLAIAGIAAVIALLGYSANRFGGTRIFSSLLPFAGGIFGFIVLTAILLLGWRRLRPRLQGWSPHLPAIIAVGLAFTAGLLTAQDRFVQTFAHYRTLVGGKEEAGRVTLAHQVFAAYRRLEAPALEKLIDRAQPYRPAVEEAARTYAIDVDLLQGLAATESSYLPRESRDGGQGLFQITQIPAAARDQVDRLFPPEQRVPDNPRYNAHLGAATLRHYLTEMKDDLFLGLLAYNIGPANGGLRFIMKQYGATDFVTIQPYLQRLPRDYPIRVLSYSLAFRIHQREGRLLAYEEGGNALRIQGIGIPGIGQGVSP